VNSGTYCRLLGLVCKETSYASCGGPISCLTPLKESADMPRPFPDPPHLEPEGGCVDPG
jgi:hypothetical protein